MRYGREDWVLKRKWGDFRALEEVVDIRPLQKWGIGGEEAWQIAVRDIKTVRGSSSTRRERVCVCVKIEVQSRRRKGERGERRK